ncbi:MAG: anaerobic ribonucleoside-triphosphate reductase [Lactobacillus amylovorus]|nr:anaerobic ribonucleoside-triphosphate reductase [Lactobacillus amylovorus]
MLSDEINAELIKLSSDEIKVQDLHAIVESSLFKVMVPVAQQYANYRNYKKDYVAMMEDTLKTADDLNYHADRSNANTTAGLISTKRSLIYTAFNKNLYKRVFLSDLEYDAIKDGYIYIHDLGARMDTYNCCLFDMGRVLQGGFEWEHIGYNEPKDVRTACNLISDVTLNCAAQQYGGFTIPEIDSILAPYARKSYNHYLKEYYEIAESEIVPGAYVNETKAHQWAMQHVERDICQGFQGFEHTFNTVASSRGDYPFVTMTGGCEEDEFGQLVWHCALKVRREGQGHPGKKRPAIFPKLVFLYTEKLHSKGKKMYNLFLEGVQTSAAAMYPDWLSLDKPEGAKSALADVFAKYHKFGVENSRWKLGDDGKVYENPDWVDAIVSPMGCRAYLSPLYQSGNLNPVDENDKPVFHGRFNGGAVSLNLPMIYMKAKEENKDFFEVLEYYCDMIDKIHIKTYEFLSKLKASCNPVAFCEGGFGKLGFNDEIRPLVDRITFSYGFTALHELQMLATGQSLYEVRNDENAIAWQAEKFINNYVNKKKKEREEGKVPYIAAIYATPAESLCGTQLNQFRDKYGIIKGVSDKAYFTNSFHMWVGEDITPWQKQDAEFKFFHESSGGHIQYCRFTSGMNTEYIAATIERAMKMGFYFGINIEKSYCGDCGTEVEDGIDTCPHCGSHDITTINRVCGYLGYSRVDGTSKMNDAKLAEIADRKSM